MEPTDIYGPRGHPQHAGHPKVSIMDMYPPISIYSRTEKNTNENCVFGFSRFLM